MYSGSERQNLKEVLNKVTIIQIFMDDYNIVFS